VVKGYHAPLSGYVTGYVSREKEDTFYLAVPKKEKCRY